jgi:arylsulfatase A-like enzyme
MRPFRAALACALVLAAACADEPTAPPPVPTDSGLHRGVVAGPAAADNVLILLVDALRADHLGCYGYPRPTSPTIDAFAAEGTRFANAISPAPWTLPVMGTIWTGLYPSLHGAVLASDVWKSRARSFTPVSTLDASRTTLAEVLAGAGVRTAAFVNGSYPGKVFGFGQGFEHFVDDELPGLRLNVEALLEWIDYTTPQRFFAYVHTGEVHSPYGPTEDARLTEGSPSPRVRYLAAALREERERYASLSFEPDYDGDLDGSLESLQRIHDRGRPAARDFEHLIALYDRGIRYTDHWVGVILKALESRGLDRRTVVLITADHGDELFDHGGFEHTKTFYEEMVRVPFLLRVPREGNGRVVAQQVGLIDVFPTVLDLMGVSYDGPVQGISLRPALRGDALPERPMFGEASQVPKRRAVRMNGHKYVRDGDGSEELYDLTADPGERTNLCARDAAPCDPYRSELALWEAQTQLAAKELALPTASEAVVDDDTREKLRALGYL